ncbi:hypothetical protein LINPERHAP2_LOCUS22859 [Linum perenne]
MLLSTNAVTPFHLTLSLLIIEDNAHVSRRGV